MSIYIAKNNRSEYLNRIELKMSKIKDVYKM